MSTLAAFIRENKQQILDRWVIAVSTLPSAQGTPRRTVLNHVPDILDNLADAIDRDDVTSAPLYGLPNVHAALRLREGYDLRQVVAEYRALRRVIHEMYSESEAISAQSRPTMRPLRVMHSALDAAIGDAVDQFAVDRDRAREIFIAMLGHDLRAPLHAIVVGGELLSRRKDALDAAALKVAGQIRSSAMRMEKMIGDLLDFARGRFGGGLPIVTAAVDARRLIAEIVAEIAHAHPDRDIQCLAGKASGDFAAEWDADRVTQAITNLVTNAITHGSDPILVEPVDQGERITVYVRNTGEIPAHVLPHLFSAFSHYGPDRRRDGTDTEVDRRRGSLGLGLYIVQEIAHAHGGRVRAQSAQGRTEVAITLPKHPKGQPAGTAAADR
jgi:signal transduction histidine kinase